jgi:hypothetical protein
MHNNLEVGTTIKFYSYWTDNYMIGTIKSLENGGYKVSVKNNRVSTIFIEPKDITQVIDKTIKFEPIIEEIPVVEEVVEEIPIVEEVVEEEPIVEEVVEEEPVKEYPFVGLFANGGTAKSINELPNELTIFIPLYDADGKPASDNEVQDRIDNVKDFLKRHFGEFLVQDMGSSYIDNEGNLIMRKTIQVTSYPSDEEFNNHKSILINQIGLWAGFWQQDYIVFEHEEDVYFIMPLEDMFKQGGELWIQDAVNQMKKKGTLGAFTKQAKREGLTPIQFAKKVLKNPKGYTLKTRRRATFVKNVNPDKF